MVEVPLTKGKVALIDHEDAERVLCFKWTAFYNPRNSKWYARRGIRCDGVNHTIYLHRFLMDAPDGSLVDHINGDGLDDQKGNLRLATNRQNQFNMRKLSRNQSGYKGVCYDKRRGTYNVACQAGDYSVRLSGYKTAIEAARIYDGLARAYHGEFARLNFPEESEQAA